MNKFESKDLEIAYLLKNSKERGCILLVNEYGKSFSNIAKQKGLGNDDAGSAVNDTFMKVIDKIHKFEPRGPNSFFNWLYTIFINTIRDFHRRNKLEIVKLEFFDESNFEHDDFDGLSSIEKYVLKKIKDDYFFAGVNEDERKEIIIKALNDLKKDERDVFICYIDSMSLKEISQYFNIPVNNLKVKLVRIRSKFINNLSKYISFNKKEVNERIKKLH